MLKPSRYNFWANLDADSYLLFNGFTGAMYELDGLERELALSIFRVPDNSAGSVVSLRDTLVDGGFLIREDVDEIEHLISLNTCECANHEALDVVIAPTYACNFRCVYCYIDFSPTKMSPAVEQRIGAYLEQSFATYPQINISWFGGEPLLGLPQVLRLSQRAKRMAEKEGATLRLFISTNGYLLNFAVGQALVNAGVDYFHITVDGTARYHDRLRVLANGRPTFDKIVGNMVALLQHAPTARLTLRMNANEANIDSSYELLPLIPAEFRHRVQVNITPIRSAAAPELFLYQKINLATRFALQLGYAYSDTQISINRRTFCNADKRGNFQVGWDGTLYKCSPGFDKPEVRVGWLDDNGSPIMGENFDIWHRDLPLYERCRECPFFCFCAGGCRLERLRGNMYSECRDKYADMDNLIINRYIALRNGGLRGG